MGHSMTPRASCTMRELQCSVNHWSGPCRARTHIRCFTRLNVGGAINVIHVRMYIVYHP